MSEPSTTELFEPGAVGQRTSLCATRCEGCGRHSFPSRTHCPGCGEDTKPVSLAGPARLRVLTGVRAQPPGSKVEAPYNAGVAEFDEGICIIGLVVGPAERGDLVVPVVHEPYEGGCFFAFAAAETIPG